MAIEPVSTTHFTGAPSPSATMREVPDDLLSVADHMPFLIALATLPQMSRWQVVRIAERAVECLDFLDGDPDAEPIDEREPEGGEAIGFHGMDQRVIIHWGGEWREA